MDIDDEVVLELDVALNEPQSIYLLQYPLRPRYRPYGDQGTLLSATISEETLNLHYSIDTNSTNYDRANTEFKRDTQILSGKRIAPLTKYCTGYITNNTLTLTPLDKILQIRPDTNFIDNVLEKKNLEDKEELAQINQDKDMKKLRVYKKKEAKIVNKEVLETKLNCFDMKSAESLNAFQSLHPAMLNQAIIKTSDEYLSSILPIPSKKTGFKDYLRSLPVSLAIEEILKEAFVINTEEVLEILPNEKNIENWIGQKAIIIDQRWVAKSELLNTGTDRDICLYFLWRDGFIVRSRYYIISINLIIGKDCIKILQQICVKQNNIWKIKGNPGHV